VIATHQRSRQAPCPGFPKLIPGMFVLYYTVREWIQGLKAKKVNGKEQDKVIKRKKD
jgi:hypothetical protein